LQWLSDRKGPQRRRAQAPDLLAPRRRCLGLARVKGQHLEVLVTETEQSVAGPDTDVDPAKDRRDTEPLFDPTNSNVEIR
jgi:hypothetical protein